METTVLLTSTDVKKGEPVTLVSQRNPTPVETVYLSNIDQTVAFPVETVFFFEAATASETADIFERLTRSVSEVLLNTYYFMAGRLNFNLQAKRFELVCNNAGVLFVGATSSLLLKDLGDVSLPNPSFEHLILRIDGSKSLAETPIFTIQVTRFQCGGFSVGFVTNHSILDGRSAAEMLENLASICRGEGMKKKTSILCNDRTCIRARDPPQINYPHTEYTKLADVVMTSLSSSFTSPNQSSSPTSSLTPITKPLDAYTHRVFSFSPGMISSLKAKAMTKCSSFEAIVAHIWRARTKAVFDDPERISSVLFAVDIRSKISPPLPDGFIGNSVITACASAKVMDLDQKHFSFCVGMVRAAIERLTDEYVRSVIDWLEVYKGVPSALDGNFYASAWWKLPFYDLDFGHGKPLYGGPVVSGMAEFVLLLSDGRRRQDGDGVNVWVVLEREKMERFMGHVFNM